MALITSDCAGKKAFPKDPPENPKKAGKGGSEQDMEMQDNPMET